MLRLTPFARQWYFYYQAPEMVKIIAPNSEVSVIAEIHYYSYL